MLATSPHQRRPIRSSTSCYTRSTNHVATPQPISQPPIGTNLRKSSSPSQSEGDACEARRGCTKPTQSRHFRGSRPWWRDAVGFPSPFTGAVHNRRHSGEIRNPEGKGNGKRPRTLRHSCKSSTSFLQIINVIPAHRQRHSRTSSTPSRTSSTPSRTSSTPSRTSSTPSRTSSTSFPHIVNVIPALRQRHSRGRGNPEKTTHAVVPHCAGETVVFMCPWIPASAGMTACYMWV